MKIEHIPNRLNRILRKIYARLGRFSTDSPLFQERLIVHFSYHKCLTVYYNEILGRLSQEFDFYIQHYNSNTDEFLKGVFRNNKYRVLSLNNKSNLPFDKFPPFRGSHFVRDPRDLIVSGYRYHLWTEEEWCKDPNFDWSNITAFPQFSELISQNPDEYPDSISYQDYLKKLDKEKGLILELIWRQPAFSEMAKWNFTNEDFIELRYEDIIGNEEDSFTRIFHHYGFNQQLIHRGVEIAEELSLRHMKKSETTHVRKGTPNQWTDEFTPAVKDTFKEMNGQLLISLGYEKDFGW